jgi:protein involved in ribonucleotide reduction
MTVFLAITPAPGFENNQMIKQVAKDMQEFFATNRDHQAMLAGFAAMGALKEAADAAQERRQQCERN